MTELHRKDDPLDPRTAWQRLLSALAPEPSTAATRYLSLHEHLIRFFRHRRMVDAETLADHTFDRVACKLAAGVRPACLERYVVAVARYIARESERRQRRQCSLDELEVAPSSDPRELVEQRARRSALAQQLATLPAETQQLLQRYYGVELGSPSGHRRRLAAELRISSNSLRIRVHRLMAELRERLELEV